MCEPICYGFQSSDTILLLFQLKWIRSVWGGGDGGEGWTKCFLSVSDGILPSSKLWVCCFNQKGEMKLYTIYWKMSVFTDGFRPNWLYRGDPGNFYDLGDWKYLNSIDHLLLLYRAAIQFQFSSSIQCLRWSWATVFYLLGTLCSAEMRSSSRYQSFPYWSKSSKTYKTALVKQQKILVGGLVS